MNKKIKKYLLLLAVGALILPIGITEAFEQRQAFFIGGEWLLLIIPGLIRVGIDSVKEFIATWRGSEANE